MIAIEMKTIATGLDIWELIKEDVPFEREGMSPEDIAIESCVLYLTVEGHSFVKMKYYEVEYVAGDLPNYMSEEPLDKWIILSPEDISKMFSKLRQTLDLPMGIHSLHTLLEKEAVTYFDIKMTPFFR